MADIFDMTQNLLLDFLYFLDSCVYGSYTIKMRVLNWFC